MQIARHLLLQAEFIVAGHEVVGNAHQLPEHLTRGFRQPDIVVVALGHLPDPVEALQQREGHRHLLLHAF